MSFVRVSPFPGLVPVSHPRQSRPVRAPGPETTWLVVTLPETTQVTILGSPSRTLPKTETPETTRIQYPFSRTRPVKTKVAYTPRDKSPVCHDVNSQNSPGGVNPTGNPVHLGTLPNCPQTLKHKHRTCYLLKGISTTKKFNSLKETSSAKEKMTTFRRRAVLLTSTTQDSLPDPGRPSTPNPSHRGRSGRLGSSALVRLLKVPRPARCVVVRIALT